MCFVMCSYLFFFFKQKTAYEMRISDWSSDVCSSDLFNLGQAYKLGRGVPADLAQAESWYRRAAKQGHLQAEDNLGLVLFTAGRRQEAMPYIEASAARGEPRAQRSEEHTSELQSLMRISYAVFCLKKKNTQHKHTSTQHI